MKDPEAARKPMPFARRSLSDSGYYETFNRDNVELVDCEATPIVELTANSIKTSDGEIYELDVVIVRQDSTPLVVPMTLFRLEVAVGRL